MATRTVYLIGGDDDEIAKITDVGAEGQRCLSCEYRGKSVSSAASDYFSALCRVREQLEKENLLLFCYGASLNVYPLERGRDMSAGMFAHKLVSGQQVSREHLVDIFAEGADVIPSTVANQWAFYQEWIESIRS